MAISHRKAILIMTVLLGVFQVLPSVVAQNSLDSYAFKNSHNSYARPHPLNDQIDNYNVWSLELDLCCRKTGDTLWISVQHGCGSSHGNFVDHLTEMMLSRAWDKRVTFVWLDIKHEYILCSCDNWPIQTEHSLANFVYNDIQAVISDDLVYTHEDFKNNSRLWPSLDDLLSQGKHFVFIIDGGNEDGDHWDTDKPDHWYFFVTATSKAKATEYGKPWIRVLNRKNGDLPDGEWPVDGDGYLWRAWNLNDDEEFYTALSEGFNLLGTDYYWYGWTETEHPSYVHPYVHPPVPLFVNYAAGPQEFGTSHWPFLTVNGAVDRAYPGIEVEVNITGGITGGWSYDEALMISKPLTLRAMDSEVIIGQTAGIRLTTSGAFKISNNGGLRID